MPTLHNKHTIIKRFFRTNGTLDVEMWKHLGSFRKATARHLDIEHSTCPKLKVL